jgi:hypothetical protein
MLILGEMRVIWCQHWKDNNWGNFQVYTRSTVEEGNIGRVALGHNYTVMVKAESQASSAMQKLGADLEFVLGPTYTT